MFGMFAVVAALVAVLIICYLQSELSEARRQSANAWATLDEEQEDRREAEEQANAAGEFDANRIRTLEARVVSLQEELEHTGDKLVEVTQERDQLERQVGELLEENLGDDDVEVEDERRYNDADEVLAGLDSDDME